MMSEALKLTILVHKPYETRRRKISAPSVTTVDEAIMDAILLAISLLLLVLGRHEALCFDGQRDAHCRISLSWGSHGSGANAEHLMSFWWGSHGSGSNHGRNGGIRSVVLV